jgi:hypothetical protein
MGRTHPQKKGALIFVLSLSFVASALSMGASTGPTQGTQKEAAHAWENAIAAKGGRERLHAVRNMVISTQGEYTSKSFTEKPASEGNTAGTTRSPRIVVGPENAAGGAKGYAGLERDEMLLSKKNLVRREEVCVFPDKYWFWDDYRPDVFGLTISMYNYESYLSYVTTDVEANHSPERITNPLGQKALITAQLDFLMETKWLRPGIIKASTGMINSEPVDIIETTVNGERIDFIFGQKTHLPIQINYHDVPENKSSLRVHRFSDYTDVGGIKVPSTVEYGDGSKYRLSIKFNVQYNESIFKKAPPISAGPEAWKARR